MSSGFASPSKRIAIACTYLQDSERIYQRWRRYRVASREYGLPDSAARVVETSFGYRQGAEALLTLLERESA